MALFLVQHGKSLSKDQDPEQGLSREGIIEVKRMATVAGEYSLHVSSIWHSSKKRARQTAEIFADVLRPDGELREREGLKPLDDAAAFADIIKSEENLMVVGHLPFMERLVSYLITGAVDKTILKFQNSGIICLDMEPDANSWVIRWALVPNIG